MNITIDKESGCATIRREKGDPKIYRESTLLVHIARELNKRKRDCIVKRMHKDRHMVSDLQHYIRDRYWNWAIWDEFGWSIRRTYTPYNQDGVLVLKFEDWSDMPKGKNKVTLPENFLAIPTGSSQVSQA